MIETKLPMIMGDVEEDPAGLFVGEGPEDEGEGEGARAGAGAGTEPQLPGIL